MTASRDRYRDPAAATVRLLKLLILVPHALAEDVHIPTAAASIPCDINTVHQAAHRLREMGLDIQTIPGPPWNQWTGGAHYYRLDPQYHDYARVLLEMITGDLKIT